MVQMKEQSKTPEKELSDEEIANLSDVEFKTLVMKMLTKLMSSEKNERTNEAYPKLNKGHLNF